MLLIFVNFFGSFVCRICLTKSISSRKQEIEQLNMTKSNQVNNYWGDVKFSTQSV